MGWFGIIKNTGEYSLCEKCGKQFKTLSHKTKSRICNACKKSPLKTGASSRPRPKRNPPFKVLPYRKKEMKKLPKEERAKIRERWNAMSPKQQKQFKIKERSKKLSSEHKSKTRKRRG
jgi:hypothetical protein